MKTEIIGLRVLLGVASVYHVILGILGMFAKSRVSELAAEFFHFKINATPEVLWMLNPFAAYMLAFGLMLAVTASNPLRFRPLVFVAAGLFLLRVVQRGVFIATADDGFKTVVSPAQNMIHLAVVSIMGVLMLVLALRAKPCQH